MNIPLLDLKAQYTAIKDEIKAAINEVLESQHFILGPKVKELETEIAKYSRCKFALGVSSGTDAILLALMALGIGADDIVITTPYTFFATVGCIARVGANPAFVDIDIDTFNICPDKLTELLDSIPEEKLSRVKAVIPVHLFGQMADMNSIVPVCKRYGLRIIEDAAQAIGAEYKFNNEIKRAGSIGDIGCFSFFPSKNLGGYGDGGMIVTNDEGLYEKMKILRTHGSQPKYYHKYVGGNFRLDEIQAAVLLVKLRYLDQWTRQRQFNAEHYDRFMKSCADTEIFLPKPAYKEMNLCNYHIYNQYNIRTKNRDKLKSYLKDNGVGTEIYYPVPMHIQECFSYLGYREGQFNNSEKAAKESLALPVYPEMTEESIKAVSDFITDFYKYTA